MAVRGRHSPELFKGHSSGITSGITLFTGLCPFELLFRGFLEKESRVLAPHQLLHFIIQALHRPIIGDFSLADKVSQQRLHSRVVLCFGVCQGQINGVGNLQRLQFGGVILVLLGIVRLKLGDLFLKGGGISAGLLQGFKLGVPFLDCGFRLGQSVYRPYPGNGENGMKKPPPARAGVVYSTIFCSAFFLKRSI